jgi:hypothetical protein
MDVLGGLPVIRGSFPLKYLGLPLSVRQLKRVDFQPLEDKMAGKLVNWDGKNITATGRGMLVKSELSSQAIFHLTPLIIPPGCFHAMKKIERAFLWAGTREISGGKCKINWETVCRPTRLGGLGILHLEKFARALHLRWPWLEWHDRSKLWIGLGNPCGDTDMNLFYAATTITIGNGNIALFWSSPWLNGTKPKDIAPLIYEASSKKRLTVKQAMLNNAWISNIKMDASLTIPHIHQYIRLWNELNGIHLRVDEEDNIVWNLSPNGEYSTSSAYKAQFFGATLTCMNEMVWKAWATPKVKFFAWLTIQNRLWTADHLEKRGWDNCGLCPLCKQTQETVAHLLSHCRFTKRVWTLVKEWLGIPSIRVNEWTDNLNIKEWWMMTTFKRAPERKVMSSLVMLTSWIIWKERNAWVFNNKAAPPSILLGYIKSETKMWATVGAKNLSCIIPGD